MAGEEEATSGVNDEEVISTLRGELWEENEEKETSTFGAKVLVEEKEGDTTAGGAGD